MTATDDGTVPEPLRRMLLAAVIAELCGGQMVDVRCSVCPGCGYGPAVVLPAWQAMCDRDECPVFMWDPRNSEAEFWANAREVEITSRPLGGSDGQ